MKPYSDPALHRQTSKNAFSFHCTGVFESSTHTCLLNVHERDPSAHDTALCIRTKSTPLHHPKGKCAINLPKARHAAKTWYVDTVCIINTRACDQLPHESDLHRQT